MNECVDFVESDLMPLNIEFWILQIDWIDSKKLKKFLPCKRMIVKIKLRKFGSLLEFVFFLEAGTQKNIGVSDVVEVKGFEALNFQISSKFVFQVTNDFRVKSGI